MSNIKPSSEEESFEYSDSAFDEDFKFDFSYNDEIDEEDTTDYLTPTTLPEDAIKDCDQVVDIEFPSLESISKDNPIEMSPIYFDKYKLTPQFVVDLTDNNSVSCYLNCEEKIILDASLYIPSLGKVSFNRYCSFGKSSNSQKLSPALFSASEVPTEPIPKSYFSFHKTPMEKYCRQYFNCIGLSNSGMTCYLNSLIQCLFYLKPFREIIFNCNTSLAKKSEIANAMRVLFTRMQISYLPVSTRDLTTAFGWNSIDFLFQQHDVQELTRLLLSRLDDVTKNQASSLFKGKNEVTIVTSQSLQSHFEEFSDLSLTVNGISTLEESLSKYYEPDKLTGDNQYQLEDGTKCDAEVRTTVTESPTILSLHLRRFEYSKEMFKVYSRFEYKEELVFNGEEYELLSIITHNGSVRGGHYNAFVKINGLWTNFDDESVRHCEPYEALDQNFGNGEKSQFTAYVLFYGKKGVNDIEEPEPPQDVIESERERLSKTWITICYDSIENSKEIQVKKDLDSKSFIQELSKKTGIPEEKIVVRSIEDNFASTVLQEPVPNPGLHFYIDDSPLLPIWVQFWIPNHEIIDLGTFHITSNEGTARQIGQEVLQKVGMIQPEEENSMDKYKLNYFYILDHNFTPIDNSADEPIDQSCCLLFQFTPESATNETIDLFKNNLIQKKKDKIFTDSTKLEESNLPKYESHLNLLDDEIHINTVNDFYDYMIDTFDIDFYPFDDPENEEKKITLSLSKHLSFDQLKKCISRKISNDDELIDINRIQIYLPDKFFKGSDHNNLNSEIFKTIETIYDNYDVLFYEVLDEDMRFFQRADVTVVDSKGERVQRIPALFPRGQRNTIGDLRKKLTEIIGNSDFYLYYVKGPIPTFISTFDEINDTINENPDDENNNNTENNEDENKNENNDTEQKDNENNNENAENSNNENTQNNDNENTENKENNENNHDENEEAEIQTEKVLENDDSEIIFDYKIFAQIFDKNEILEIKHMNEKESENLEIDYTALDDDDVLKLRVMRCDQLYTFYKSPHLPFILFTEKGKKWKDIKEMFPNEKIEMMKQNSRNVEPIDADDTRQMVDNDIFAIVYNKTFNSLFYSENSLLQIKNEIDEFNNERYLEEEEEEEEEAEEERPEEEKEEEEN